MSMKVDGSSGVSSALGLAGFEAGARKARTASATDSVAATTEADRVRLSDVGSELSAMTRNVGDSAPVDVAKVERVRAALAEGSFKFDAGTTASRLIQIESLLGPR